jgi:hypothetical protein
MAVFVGLFHPSPPSERRRVGWFEGRREGRKKEEGGGASWLRLRALGCTGSEEGRGEKPAAERRHERSRKSPSGVMLRVR